MPRKSINAPNKRKGTNWIKTKAQLSTGGADRPKPANYFNVKMKQGGYEEMTPEQFKTWQPEYRSDWQSFQINRGGDLLAANIAIKLIKHKQQYLDVQRFTGVPWYWIAAIHNRESDANFTTHLHNGDPLSARTYHVPANRPLVGEPPFSWVESAIDALTLAGYTTKTTWSIEEMLYRGELYNGLGPRRKGIKTGYLWSYTDKYIMGKYVFDGRWNGKTVDVQMGLVPIWQALAKQDQSIKYYYEPDDTQACTIDPMFGR